MKKINYLILLVFVLISSCDCDCDNEEPGPVDPNTELYIPIDVDEINLGPEFDQFQFLASDTDKGSIPIDSNGFIVIPEEFKECIDSNSAPSTIEDLTYGLTLDAYTFNKESQGKLGFLGFGNVEVQEKETVIVVEYKQSGTQICNGRQLFYGVGARLMMHVKENKRNAKINTPQQISASVTFGRADVIFSIKTFGITGPGVSRLVKAGTMTENTYSEFLNEIAGLIVDAYSDTSNFTIDPQPLFLKKN